MSGRFQVTGVSDEKLIDLEEWNLKRGAAAEIG
jgi:hypothetical protein